MTITHECTRWILLNFFIRLNKYRVDVGGCQCANRLSCSTTHSFQWQHQSPIQLWLSAIYVTVLLSLNLIRSRGFKPVIILYVSYLFIILLTSATMRRGEKRSEEEEVWLRICLNNLRQFFSRFHQTENKSFLQVPYVLHSGHTLHAPRTLQRSLSLGFHSMKLINMQNKI